MKITQEITTGEKHKRLENGAVIWSYSKVFPGAIIGENVTIGGSCEIHAGCMIGKDTTIGAGVKVWSGVYIGERCFIAPDVRFTNDHHPVNKNTKTEKFIPHITHIGDDVKIYTDAIIIAPIKIGSGAEIAAGATVNHDIEPAEEYKGLMYEKLKKLDDRLTEVELKLQHPPYR